MTVGQLIEMLQMLDNPEAEVGFAYPSGDYWRTTVVAEVGQVDQLDVSWSAYHDKFALPRDDEDGGRGEGEQTIVVLR
jgi:hypothetical protein